MKYEMNCDDGFVITSNKKEEAATMAAIHIMTMHPKEKVSMNDILAKLKKT